MTNSNNDNGNNTDNSSRPPRRPRPPRFNRSPRPKNSSSSEHVRSDETPQGADSSEVFNRSNNRGNRGNPENGRNPEDSRNSRSPVETNESSNIRNRGRVRNDNNRPQRGRDNQRNQSGRQESSRSESGFQGTRSHSRSGSRDVNRLPRNQSSGSGISPSFFSGVLKDRAMLKSYFARTIILIPTYNERENISRLISNIHELYSNVYILVIDDSSPDGTAEVVRDLGRRNRKIMLLDKGKKEGIGKAYIRGFLYTLELAKGLPIDYVVQMDADFSHDPVYLTPMINAVRETDWVIGSRYAEGINVVNWPMKRIMLSYFANRYVNAVTGIGIKDATAGFKVFRLSVLRQINLRKVVSNGYVFQIEMNYVLKKLGFKVREIPIIFRDRQVGESKISGSIIREAMIKVLFFPFKNVKSYRRRINVN